MKIHEILNLKDDEKFMIKGFEPAVFQLVENGSRLVNEGITMVSAFLCDIINDPPKIVRLPRLTAEQRRALEWLQDNGMKTVTMDGDGTKDMFAHAEEVEDLKKFGRTWTCEHGCESVLDMPLYASLLPLIPDWKTPLNIADTLKDAKEKQNDT